MFFVLMVVVVVVVTLVVVGGSRGSGGGSARLCRSETDREIFPRSFRVLRAKPKRPDALA